jgi:hypothetical protein
VVVRRPKLLVQLLARPGSDHLNHDVSVGLPARQANHLSREVENRDRLAHVEHEDAATTTDRAGLDDELNGFRDRHEVARHLRVGQRQRPALRDLATEDRDHRAGGAEDVAETDSDEARRDIVAMPESLDDPLAQRLRLSHDRLRVDGLVRRDEDEAVGAELDRDLGHGPRGKRVVAHGLDGVRLDQRHVLVRRCMEHDRGTVGLENLAHLGPVLHICQDRQSGRKPALVHELPFDLEERGLGVVDEDEARRSDP